MPDVTADLVARRTCPHCYYGCGEHAVDCPGRKEGMPERHGDPRFYALLDEISDLHSRKNHDYAKTDEPLSNFHKSRDLGVEPWRGVLVRMSDKWSRIEQLAGGKVPKNESLRDSLIDLAVYALIDVLLLEDAG